MTDVLEERSPAAVGAVMPVLKRLMQTYFRSEVRDMGRVPDGGALLVSNHSGGLIPMDVPILAYALVDQFGSERPFHVLAHDMLFSGPLGPVMRAMGFLPATRDNATTLLRSGSVTIVFPGGDHDVFRPTTEANRIDFAGRTGYVRTALGAGVPIVPVVSIGGHETQLYLARGERVATLLRLDKLLRTSQAPLLFGFPFGLTGAVPVNLPMPSKIVTQVLEPVHIVAEFGPEPDVAEVDAEIRRRMQAALDDLAAQRRFPVLG